MAEPHNLVAKRVYLCDDVVTNPATGKPMVVNLWEVVRVPAGHPFPYRLEKLCLFAWFREGVGRVAFRIELLHAGTTELIARPWAFEKDFPDPTRTVYGKFMLVGVPFPAPGWYTVDFYCDDVLLDYLTIRVITA